MDSVRIQQSASVRLDEIYRYTRQHWGEQQAERYITGLFQSFSLISQHRVASRPVPAEFGVEGFYYRYEKHVVYWRWLSDGAVGIVTILHERVHQIRHFQQDDV